MTFASNQILWSREFYSKFKELDKRELAPHANTLFDKVYEVHELTGRAVFTCRDHSKNYKWHSFRARMSFKYQLVKEGKPKRRKGKVTMIPLGQQCKKCKPAEEEEEGIYLLPCFLPEAIKDTIQKIYDKVVANYYTSNNGAEKTFFLPKINRNVPKITNPSFVNNRN